MSQPAGISIACSARKSDSVTVPRPLRQTIGARGGTSKKPVLPTTVLPSALTPNANGMPGTSSTPSPALQRQAPDSSIETK